MTGFWVRTVFVVFTREVPGHDKPSCSIHVYPMIRGILVGVKGLGLIAVGYC